MKNLLLGVVLVSIALQFGCTSNPQPTTQAAREPAMSDSDLKNKIETQLRTDPQLQDISISADADKNRATLSGTVATEAMRSRALELARASHPGLVIEDKIDVKPAEITRTDYTPEMARTEVERARAKKETVGGSIDDAWIHAKLVAKLLADSDTPEHKINVDVDHNIVTLRGIVETPAARAEAERIAKETDGVKRVNNMLKVGKS
jgi:osmotically-inducible protein OsmY